jgi:hypothetical protein
VGARVNDVGLERPVRAIRIALLVVALLLLIVGTSSMYGGMSQYVIPPSGELPASGRLEREWTAHIQDAGDFRFGAYIATAGVGILVLSMAVRRLQASPSVAAREQQS